MTPSRGRRRRARARRAHAPMRSRPRCSRWPASTGRSIDMRLEPAWPASRSAAARCITNDAFAALRAGIAAPRTARVVGRDGSGRGGRNEAGRDGAHDGARASASSAAPVTSSSARSGPARACARPRARRRCSRSALRGARRAPTDELFEAHHAPRAGVSAPSSRRSSSRWPRGGDEVAAAAARRSRGELAADEVLGVARSLEMLDDVFELVIAGSVHLAGCVPSTTAFRAARRRGRAASRRSSRCASAPSIGAARLALDTARRDAVTSHMRREIARAAGGGRRDAARRSSSRPRRWPRRVRGRGLDRVVLVARGTSDHVAIYARYLLEARCALSASLRRALALHHVSPARRPLAGRSCSASRSRARRPRSCAALEFAAGRGALTAALTNEAGSSLATCGRARARDRGGRASSRSRRRRRSRRSSPRSRSSRAHSGAERPGGGARGAPRSARHGRGAARRARRVAARSLARRRRGGLHRARIRLRDGARGGAQAQGDLRALGGGLQRGRPAPRPARGRAAACRRSSSTRVARSPATSTDSSASCGCRLARRLDRPRTRAAGGRGAVRGARPDRADRARAAHRRAAGRAARPRSRPPAGPHEGHAHPLTCCGRRPRA